MPPTRDRLVALLGWRGATALMRAYGGSRLRVPTIGRENQDARDRAIIATLGVPSARRPDMTVPLRDVADVFGLSVRHVKRISKLPLD